MDLGQQWGPTHRVGLVLAAVELVAVVEDVFVGGVEACLHAVLHHLAGSGWALQLLDLCGMAAGLQQGQQPPPQSCRCGRRKYLHPEKGDAGQQVHCGLEVLQPLRTAGREVVLPGGERRVTLGGDSRPYCPCGETEAQQCLTRYMERSMRSELCSWSRSLTKRSFCRETPRGRVNGGTEVGAAPSPLHPYPNPLISVLLSCHPSVLTSCWPSHLHLPCAWGSPCSLGLAGIPRWLRGTRGPGRVRMGTAWCRMHSCIPSALSGAGWGTLPSLGSEQSMERVVGLLLPVVQPQREKKKRAWGEQFGVLHFHL